MQLSKTTALDDLNNIVKIEAEKIHNYTKHKGYFTRTRKLPPAILLKLILNMEGNSLNAELFKAFPNIDERVTASAFEQAKDKLQPNIFQDLLQEFNQTAKHRKKLDGKYYVYAIDGSDFNTPYNPSSDFLVTKEERKSKKGNAMKPYCTLHANLLYDLVNCTYQDCIFQSPSNVNERNAAIDMVKRLDNSKPFIVIMDRGYDGLNMIETLNRIDNCYYIIRARIGNGGLKEVMNLPDEIGDLEATLKVTTSKYYYTKQKNTEDNLHFIPLTKVRYTRKHIPVTYKKRWDFGEFCDIHCRIVKFHINEEDSEKEEWEVLITNLPRSEFPVKRMKKMYHMRWSIETSFRHLKYALGAVSFHSKKDDFIKMELLAHLIMYNAVSRIMAVAKATKIINITLQHLYDNDFKMACLIVRRYFYLYWNEPSDKIFREIKFYTHAICKERKNVRNMNPKTAINFLYRVA